MISMLFGFFFTFILLTIGMIFSILSYSKKSNGFFYVGLGCTILAPLTMISNMEYFYYGITTGNLFALLLLMIWGISVVYLIMSKTKSNSEKDVTDSFLDEIIESDDDWDGEI